jgi:hypothetical protein
MTLRVVGAGIGRTGTHSLKLALERLLGGPCYHMLEVFQHLDHVAEWHTGIRGESADWAAVFDGYVATVDWPGGAVWEPLSAAYPDALVLLSTRESADAWWRSASATIFESIERANRSPEGFAAWTAMVNDMLSLHFTRDWRNEAAAKDAYDRHNARVRAEVPTERLLEWQPGDGWAPLCAALGVAVPDEPFPHVNSTDDFRKMMGLDE